MDEHLNLRARVLLYLPDFLKPELARDDDALQAFLAEKVHACSALDIHLCGAVQLKVREEFLAHPHDAEILHDKPVRPDAVEIPEKTVEPLKVALLAHGVDGNVNLLVLPVKRRNGRLELVPRKVRRAEPRVEALQTEIYRIGALANRGIQCLYVARRRQ